jgi:hypothetical protein
VGLSADIIGRLLIANPARLLALPGGRRAEAKPPFEISATAIR